MLRFREIFVPLALEEIIDNIQNGLIIAQNGLIIAQDGLIIS
jgi:hypothetical protein